MNKRLVILSLCFIFFFSQVLNGIAFASMEFSATIHADGQKLGEGGQTECDIVIGIGSSDDNKEAPPSPPPEYTVDMAVYPSDWANDFTIFKYDINLLEQGQPVMFIIKIDPHGNVPPPSPRSATISWNPLELTADGNFKLIQGYDLSSSPVVVNDMKNTNSYVVTGDGKTYYSVVFTPNDVPDENHKPVAQNDTIQVYSANKSSNLIATDQDGDTLTYKIVTQPTKGNVSITNIQTGDYTYTPNPNETGIDSFTFQANDGELDSDPATISINITDGENLIIVSSPEPAYVGEEVELILTLKGNGVYGLQLLMDLNTNSNPLTIKDEGAYGDVFDSSSSFNLPPLVVDNKSWRGVVSLQNPAMPLTGEEIFAKIKITSTERCKVTLTKDWFDIIIGDKDSNELPFSVLQGTVEFIENLVTCDLGSTYANLTVTLVKDDNGTEKIIQLDSNGKGIFENIVDGSYTLKIKDFQPVPVIVNNSNATIQCSDMFYTSDVNLDGKVDIGDFTFIGGSFMLSKGDTNYQEKADLTGDDKINVLDLIQVGAQFNSQSCSQ